MTDEQKIKVLVVEDSNVVQMLLVHLLNSDPKIQVIGTARNGREAIEFVDQQLPDVILMDVEMPEMDGFEATRRIMESRPVPIVICSAHTNPRGISTAFRLMEVGAVAFVEKPHGAGHTDSEAMASHLLQTVKLMSEVRVVRRWPRIKLPPGTSAIQSPLLPRKTAPQTQLIGIGASTGGPPVLQTILSTLPKDFPVPIVVVQHIAPGFLEGLVEWLNQTTGVKVHIAAYGVQALPGHVYFAPDNYHMTVRNNGGIILSREEPENGLRPSVDCLFRSIAKSFGSNAVGVLLTGMGKDGAQELKQMKDRGALTIAQDRATSVVHGMPGEAIALGGASYILPPEKIAPALVAHINGQPF